MRSSATTIIPAYSDQQISEAFAARAINDITNSPYWPESAIIITYDETDGFYDHVSPERRSTFADGSPLQAGPRIPTILISPYAASGEISHRYSEHGSVIKFINELFGLVPLASLPDETRGRELGTIDTGTDNLGPSDDPDNDVGDLTEAFDYDILRGVKQPIDASAGVISADSGRNAASFGDAELFAERLHQWRLRGDRHPADRFPVHGRLQGGASRSIRIRLTSIRVRPNHPARRPPEHGRPDPFSARGVLLGDHLLRGWRSWPPFSFPFGLRCDCR